MESSYQTYETVKIYPEDYERAQAIRLDRGVALLEAVGAALEGWDRLPRDVQDEVIRQRAQRRHGDAAAA